MASYLQIENKHWMVMEGSINPSEQLTHITCENKEEIIKFIFEEERKSRKKW